jgi:hypothetical protein
MRFDFVFSYWIFAWYVLYVFRVTTYNPKIALIVGLIQNIGLLLLMFYYKNNWIHIATFCFIQFLIKALPLWSLRNDPYRWKDFYALVVYFMIYIIWLYVNDELHTSGLEKVLQQIKANLPVGPLMQFIDKYVRS